MAATLIENARLLQPNHAVRSGSILLDDAKVAAINPPPSAVTDDCPRIDAHGALLTPGLIDLHCHGVEHYLYERDPAEIDAASHALPRYGTTCILPTLYSVLHRNALAEIERLADALPNVTGSAMPGFHFEGPFLAITGAGAKTLPGDLVLLKELLAAAQGRVLAMSVSPDAPQVLPIIEYLAAQQIAVFLTHTRATVPQTVAAIAAGARHATHFYDVFPLPPETDAGVRPVGAVETILADPRCTVDFICDGVHVDPMAIKAAWAAKGPAKVIAITDANVGAGLGEGVYDTPWGYPIEVRGRDAARVADPQHPLHGCLAGSALTMDRAISNLAEWFDLPLEQIWAMGTANPAAAVGLTGKGALCVGADADVVLWRQTSYGWQAEMTWVAGQCVFDRALEPVS